MCDNETNPTNGSWFCPAHFCSVCCAMETPKTEIEDYPLEVATLSLHLKTVDLQQCSTCPFSLCLSCSSIVNGHRAGRGAGRPSAIGTTSAHGFKTISTQILKANDIRSPQYAVMLTQLSKGSLQKKVSNISFHFLIL